MKPITRIPRPQTLTFQIKQLRNLKNPIGEKKRIIKYILENNMYLGDQLMNLNQIAQLVQLPLKAVIREMTKVAQLMDLGQENNNDILGSVGSLKMAFLMSLEDRAKIVGQFNLLAASQGQKYVPFLTSQVNAAAKNLLDSQKTFHGFINIVNQAQALELKRLELGNNGPTNGTQYLTTQEALNLLEGTIIPIAQLPNHLAEPTGVPMISALGEDIYQIRAINEVPENQEAEPIPKGQTSTKKPIPKPKHIERNEVDAEIITEDDLEDDEHISFLGSL